MYIQHIGASWTTWGPITNVSTSNNITQVMEEHTTHKIPAFLLYWILILVHMFYLMSFFFFAMVFMSSSLREEYFLLVQRHHFCWRQDVEKPTFSGVLWPYARRTSNRNGKDSIKTTVVIMHYFYLIWCKNLVFLHFSN